MVVVLNKKFVET